jgi:sugar phosphate isomerase/epimerase
MFASLSRRRFMAASAAAGGAISLGIPQVLLAQEKDPWGGFPIGVQSYSLRKYKLDEAIRHLQGMGVRYVEFAGTHLSPDASDSEINHVLALLKQAGLKISAHGVNRFTNNHDANRKLFEFAKRIGARTITADPNPDSFDSLDKLVAEYDIRIAIHNHGPTHRYNKVESVVNAVKDHDKRIGACVDCGHYLRSGEDPVKCVLTVGERVYGVHMKDEAETNTPRSANVVIGKGHLDVVGLFRALKQVKFPADGALSLEYEANPDNPIDDMKACLQVAKDAIAKSA